MPLHGPTQINANDIKWLWQVQAMWKCCINHTDVYSRKGARHAKEDELNDLIL
jgi:hypothetical protein